jgi:hypothetical protein
MYGYIQYMGPFGQITFNEGWDYLGWRPSRNEILAITQSEAMLNDLDPKKKAQWKMLFRIGRPNKWLGPVPYWVVVCVAATLTIAPWIPWIPWSNRFSLRTLLIATTLVAVVLGLVVATRQSPSPRALSCVVFTTSRNSRSSFETGACAFGAVIIDRTTLLWP